MNLETELAELKHKVEAMNDCSELVKEAYASVETFKTQASNLETVLAETKTALDTLQLEKEEAAKMYDAEMKKKKDEMEKMKAELDSANEVIAAYKGKEAEMMKKEKNMKRMATLVEAGLDNELATSSVETFDSLSDEAFDNMVSLLAAMKPKKEEMMKKMKAEETQDVSEVLETAEPENNVDLSVGSDADSELENTRAALVDFVYKRLGKTLNKGE